MNFDDLFTYDYNWMISVVLIATGFFYTILTSMIFLKDLKKSIVWLAMIVGYFYEEINVAVHSLYIQWNGNPQVSTVVYMLASTLLLTLLLSFKRFRTRERCMVALTSWAIIFAWFFIHFCLVINQLSFLEKNLSIVKERAIKDYVFEDNKEGFINFCSEKGFECLVTDTKYNVLLKTENADKKEIADAFKTIAPLHRSQEFNNGINYSIVKGKNLFFDSSAISFNAIGSRNGVFMLHDRKDITRAYDGVKYYVYHWYGIVLCAWISVCLWAIRRHRKIKPQENKIGIQIDPKSEVKDA